ncbi:6,7-dimethyl-8-ribityllumazine synthase [Robbsia andropogonis]|uniref:6,7-dimethyl-8-ribityllumazine synthase n=1 Tax=Robbsia andropogonis TaxID=28092 RepID=UPI003D1F2B7F
MSNIAVLSSAAGANDASSSATPPRFAFVQASWHANIVDQARVGFAAEMAKLGYSDDAIDYYAVPGAFELPLHAKRLAETGRYAGVVCAALVVGGGIYRHDFVAAAVVDGLMRVQLDTGVPVFSVSLTPHHFHEEAHTDYFHAHFVKKGAEAAHACTATVNALDRLPQPIAASLASAGTGNAQADTASAAA